MPWYHSSDMPDSVATMPLNRSLYIAKYADVAVRDDKGEARKASLKRLVGLKPDSKLLGIFRRSQELVVPSGCEVFHATLAGRLIVNHAGGVLENAGLALDRLTGEAYIPGSALKGIARTAAQAEGASQAETTLVFGYENEKDSCPDIKKLPKGWTAFAGSVAFMPAFPVTDAQLEMDILTCHYCEYYAGNRQKALDNESPNPQVFPVVKAGTKFRFVLAPLAPARVKNMAEKFRLPDTFDPLAKAKEWLIKGLTEHGVGAKTAAGYGWFEYDEQAEREREDQARRQYEAAEAERKRVEAEKARLAAMSPVDQHMEQLGKLPGEEFAHFARGIAGKSEDEQRAFLRLLMSDKERKQRWKIWQKKKKDITDDITEVARKLGETLT